MNGGEHLWMERPAEEIHHLKFSWIYMCLVEVEENSCNYVMQSSKLMLIFVSKIEVHSKNTLTQQVHVKLRSLRYFNHSITQSIKNKYVQ